MAAAARRLADEHGRPVRVLLAREDTVRLGPKRPPIAAGVRRRRHGRGPGGAHAGDRRASSRAAPGFEVEEVDVAGPADLGRRSAAAGWAEAAVLAGRRPR